MTSTPPPRTPDRRPPSAGRRPPPPGVRRRARTPYRWLRRVLLLAGIAGIAGLVLLLVAYNFGTVEAPVSSQPDADPGDAEVVTTGANIDYIQTSGGRKVFRVRAARSSQDEQGVSRLEEVMLDVFREDGDVYTIHSDRARLDQESLEALLEGNVVVRGLGELVLEARALEVKHKGQLLESLDDAVELRFPPERLEGRAGRLRIDRALDEVYLDEGVHVRSEPGAEVTTRLDCRRLVYKRQEGLVRAVDDVYLRRGDAEIGAHHINLFLREDQRTLRILRARWDVKGVATSLLGDGARVHAGYRGQLLEVEPEEENPELRRLRLEGAPDEPAVMDLVRDDGLARSLTGQRIDGRAEGGRLLDLEGFGDPLRLDEYLDLPEPYMLRRACSDRAVADFDAAGQLERLVLEGQVELRDEGFQASGGELAVVDPAEGRLDMRGQAVELFTERGDLVAPHVRYSRRQGLVRADGGVETTLADASAAGLSGTPLGGSGPVRVSSREATWTETPPRFVFLGDVRAWQGQNLLLAEQLRGEEASREMAASGGVKTVWIPEPNAEGGADGRPGQPVEVSSELLSYRQLDDTLVYLGGVEVVQGERTLTCRELSVTLAENGGAETMTCVDDVELVDPVKGQRASGDRAVYTVAEELVEIFGTEVRLVDAERNTLEGQYLRFDLETGEARVGVDPAEPPSPDPPSPPAGDGTGTR